MMFPQHLMTRQVCIGSMNLHCYNTVAIRRDDAFKHVYKHSLCFCSKSGSYSSMVVFGSYIIVLIDMHSKQFSYFFDWIVSLLYTCMSGHLWTKIRCEVFWLSKAVRLLMTVWNHLIWALVDWQLYHISLSRIVFIIICYNVLRHVNKHTVTNKICLNIVAADISTQKGENETTGT